MPAIRLPDPERLTTLDNEPGGLRSLGRPRPVSGVSAWDAVRTKRAVREFDGRPIEPAHLERIVRAGTRAHSSKNQQRWSFVVVEDRERLAGALEDRARTPATSPAPRRRSR